MIRNYLREVSHVITYHGNTTEILGNMSHMQSRSKILYMQAKPSPSQALSLSHPKPPKASPRKPGRQAQPAWSRCAAGREAQDVVGA